MRKEAVLQIYTAPVLKVNHINKGMICVYVMWVDKKSKPLTYFDTGM